MDGIVARKSDDERRHELPFLCRNGFSRAVLATGSYTSALDHRPGMESWDVNEKGTAFGQVRESLLSVWRSSPSKSDTDKLDCRSLSLSVWSISGKVIARTMK